MPKYIDADALKAKLRKVYYDDFNRDLLSVIINDAPSADVEPKREIVPWKVAGAFDDFHQCTKCGNMWPIFSTVEWAYCPVCGCRKFSEPTKGEDDAEVH
jgi:hypothetical protein